MAYVFLQNFIRPQNGYYPKRWKIIESTNRMNPSVKDEMKLLKSLSPQEGDT